MKKIDIFEQEVSKNGYELLDSGLIWENPGYETNIIRLLEPTDEHTEPIFKQFIRLDGTPIDFIKFTNKYGLLIPSFGLSLDNLQKNEKENYSLSFYIQQHLRLKSLDELYTNILSPNLKITESEKRNNLSNIFALEETSQRGINYIDDLSLNISDNSGWRDAFRRVKLNQSTFIAYLNIPRDMLKNAPTSIQYSDRRIQIAHLSWIDLKNCKENLYILIKLAIKKYLKRVMNTFPCRFYMNYNPVNDSWEPAAEPTSLLAALLYQFAEQLSGNRQYKFCSICEHWSDVTGKRKDRPAHPECEKKIQGKSRTDNFRKRNPGITELTNRLRYWRKNSKSISPINDHQYEILLNKGEKWLKEYNGDYSKIKHKLESERLKLLNQKAGE